MSERVSVSARVTESPCLKTEHARRCGMSRATSQRLCAPADLEGHLGDDSRFYLLDFSRVFPPETPRKDIPNAHLYYLLRPEFVKSYSEPLCSDAFSGFIALHDYKV
jgi:hypothetical protein